VYGTKRHTAFITGNSEMTGKTSGDATHPLSDGLSFISPSPDETGASVGSPNLNFRGNGRIGSSTGHKFGYTGQQNNESAHIRWRLTGVRFWAVLLSILATIVIAMPNSAASTIVEAQSGSFDCSSAIREPIKEPYRFPTLADQPLSAEGTFPTHAGDGDSAVSYEIKAHKHERNGILPTMSVWFDSVQWANQSTVLFQSLDEKYGTLSSEDEERAIQWIMKWSACAEQTDEIGMLSLISDFGFAWICSPDNRFGGLGSSAAGVCPGGLLATSRGMLPLRYFGAYRINDDRLGFPTVW
jgi:hypothetical protein